MAETPTIYGLVRQVRDAITDPYFEHKHVFVLDDQGEIHRITGVRWSEDNDCFWLLTENDVDGQGGDDA